MKNIGFLLTAVFFWGSVSLAQALPEEGALRHLMLDQKDELFYDRGVIPANQSSSLCGPTSAANWLQLQAQTFSKEELVELIKETGEALRPHYIEINRGLLETDLVRFLKILDTKLNIKRDFVIKGRTNFNIEEVWSDKIQILMLNYTEIRPQSPPGRGGRFPPRRDIPFPDDMLNDNPPVRGNHFVLKVFADKEKGLIGVIDPESPTRYSWLQAGSGNLVRPVSREDFKEFAFGIPLRWTVLSLIEEK